MTVLPQTEMETPQGFQLASSSSGAPSQVLWLPTQAVFGDTERAQRQGKSMGPGTRLCGSPVQLCHLLSLRPCASCWTSQCLIYKMEPMSLRML